jgi:5'-nucleotidase
VESMLTVGPPAAARRIYCNRTLNLRAIKAIGYDLDYTLVHYKVEPWERRAFEHTRRELASAGLQVDGLEFDPELVIRGLVVDTRLGNLLKANRFGYVTRASHGTRLLEFEEQRRLYGRVAVDLDDRRYVLLTTLFALSEACIYAQLVDRLDAYGLKGGLGYEELYRMVRRGVDQAHLEGELKPAIVADPASFVEPDPELALTLLDQKHAGKKLLLITNSDWVYSDHMMRFVLGPHLPGGMQWRDLFELVLVSARKPDFFSQRMPTFEVVSEDGLLRSSPGGIRKPGVYVGGDATQVEQYLGVSGEEILFVGDHIYVDVEVSKSVMRWRTALVLRELEGEIAALEAFAAEQEALARLMDEKTGLEYQYSQARIELQRQQEHYGPSPTQSVRALREGMGELRGKLEQLDERISPLARASGELANQRWGLHMRAGNDKSHLARQVERFADIYTSRVSNFLYETPFSYLRAPRGSLPHDASPLLG